MGGEIKKISGKYFSALWEKNLTGKIKLHMQLINIFHYLENEGVRQLKTEKVAEENIVISWSADLRYEGQSWELNTPIRPTETMTKDYLRKIVIDFNQIHQQVYSYSEPNEVVEFVNLRVRTVGQHPALSLSGEEMPCAPFALSLIHISEPTRLKTRSRMPSSA